MYNRYELYQYNRYTEPLSPPLLPPKPSVPKKTPKKKINFKTLKKNTCASLNDIECFLNNFSHTLKYIKLINLLK